MLKFLRWLGSNSSAIGLMVSIITTVCLVAYAYATNKVEQSAKDAEQDTRISRVERSSESQDKKLSRIDRNIIRLGVSGHVRELEHE